jgi:hypothetical protein
MDFGLARQARPDFGFGARVMGGAGRRAASAFRARVEVQQRPATRGEPNPRRRRHEKRQAEDAACRSWHCVTLVRE